MAKGMGMIFVIAGHTFALKHISFLYSFHMPLFFLLSGFVYNSKKYPKLIHLVQSKASQILKPWAVCYLISLLVSFAIPLWRDALSWRQMFIELYTTNSNNINNSSIWYLICLYMTFILMYFVHKCLGFIDSKKAIVILILGGGISLWMKKYLLIISSFVHLIDNRLPLKTDSAIIAVIFMYIGFRYKDYIFNLVRGTSVMKLTLLTIVFAAGCYVNGWSNINSLDFGNYKLLYYPVAFLGIYCVLGYCYMLSKQKGEIFQIIKKAFAFYGINSLVVFGFQSLLIRLYLLYFNENYGYSMVLYGNNPKIHQIGSFVLVTFILSPMIVCLFAYLRKHNIRIL